MEYFAALRERVKLYPAMIALLALLMVAGALTPVPEQFLQELYTSYTRHVASLRSSPVREVVLRVVSLKLPRVLATSMPFLGPFLATDVAVSYGLLVKAIAVNEAKSLPSVLASVYLDPTMWLQLLAFSMSLTESFFLAIALVRRARPQLELTLSILFLSAALLFLAAATDAVIFALARRGLSH